MHVALPPTRVRPPREVDIAYSYGEAAREAGQQFAALSATAQPLREFIVSKSRAYRWEDVAKQDVQGLIKIIRFELDRDCSSSERAAAREMLKVRNWVCHDLQKEADERDEWVPGPFPQAITLPMKELGASAQALEVIKAAYLSPAEMLEGLKKAKEILEEAQRAKKEAERDKEDLERQVSKSRAANRKLQEKYAKRQEEFEKKRQDLMAKQKVDLEASKAQQVVEFKKQQEADLKALEDELDVQDQELEEEQQRRVALEGKLQVATLAGEKRHEELQAAKVECERLKLASEEMANRVKAAFEEMKKNHKAALEESERRQQLSITQAAARNQAALDRNKKELEEAKERETEASRRLAAQQEEVEQVRAELVATKKEMRCPTLSEMIGAACDPSTVSLVTELLAPHDRLLCLAEQERSIMTAASVCVRCVPTDEPRHPRPFSLELEATPLPVEPRMVPLTQDILTKRRNTITKRLE